MDTKNTKNAYLTEMEEATDEMKQALEELVMELYSDNFVSEEKKVLIRL